MQSWHEVYQYRTTIYSVLGLSTEQITEEILDREVLLSALSPTAVKDQSSKVIMAEFKTKGDKNDTTGHTGGDQVPMPILITVSS